MLESERSLLRSSDFLKLELLALALAVGLAVAAVVWTSREQRRAAMQPFWLLAAHIAFVLAFRLAAPSGSVARTLEFLAILFLLSSMGRSSVLLVLEGILAQRQKGGLPKIIRDLTQGLVYTGCLLLALQSAGVEPGSILTTSALLTAVIGLSLQETLGNLFAGLAVQVQRPFDVGDWIQFDQDKAHIGRVVEINWRATKVLTLDQVEVIVPNGALARAPIVNFTKPTTISRRSVYVTAPYDVPPQKVSEVIRAALVGCFGVVVEPPISVVTNGFHDTGVEYWVRFFTDKFDQRDRVDGAVRDRIWYAFARANIGIPYPHRTLEISDAGEHAREKQLRARATEREQWLRKVDFLQTLDDASIHELALLSHQRLYAEGESIVQKGDSTAEMFVIDEGSVDVIVEGSRLPGVAAAANERILATLGAGDFFGEMALVTGERRSASVRARTACSVVVIGHAALSPMFARSPVLLEHISRILAERQAELERHAMQTTGDQEERVRSKQSELMVRIRRFFSL